MSKTLATVDDYMARDVTTFEPSEDIHVAVRVLLDERISGAPVMDEHGQLVGVLSKKDCLEMVYSTAYHQAWGGQVRDYMNQDVQTMEAGTDVVAAADQFMNTRFRRFPVIDRGRMVGLITRHDILRALQAQWAG